jgi:hypothetical protein
MVRCLFLFFHVSLLGELCELRVIPVLTEIPFYPPQKLVERERLGYHLIHHDPLLRLGVGHVERKAGLLRCGGLHDDRYVAHLWYFLDAFAEYETRVVMLHHEIRQYDVRCKIFQRFESTLHARCGFNGIPVLL